MNLHSILDIPPDLQDAAQWISHRWHASGYRLAFRPRDRTYWFKSTRTLDWTPLDHHDVQRWARTARAFVGSYDHPPCEIEVIK